MADYAYDSDDDSIIAELNGLNQRAAQEQQEEAERRAYLGAKVLYAPVFLPFFVSTALIIKVFRKKHVTDHSFNFRKIRWCN